MGYRQYSITTGDNRDVVGSHPRFYLFLLYWSDEECKVVLPQMCGVDLRSYTAKTRSFDQEILSGIHRTSSGSRDDVAWKHKCDRWVYPLILLLMSRSKNNRGRVAKHWFDSDHEQEHDSDGDTTRSLPSSEVTLTGKEEKEPGIQLHTPSRSVPRFSGSAEQIKGPNRV